MENISGAARRAGVLVLIAGLGLGVWLLLPRPLEEPGRTAVTTAPSGLGEEEPARIVGAPDAASETQLEVEAPATSAPEPEVAAPLPKPEATPAPPDAEHNPSLDVVRVDADGAAVVAGRGAAGADVILRIDGDAVATVTADGEGNFVSLFDLGPTAAPRLLTLETRDAEGRTARSADSVVVAPIYPAAPSSPDVPEIVTGAAREAPTADADDNRRRNQTGPPERRTSAGADTAGPDGPSRRVAPGPEITPRTAPGPAEPEPSRETRSGESEGRETSNVANADPSELPDRPEDLPETTAGDIAREVPPSEATVDDGRSAEAQASAAPDLPGAPTGAAAPGRPAETPPRGDRPNAPPRLIRSGPGGVSVISAAGASRPVVSETLGIDAISYDATGEVQIAGRGLRDGQVRIYLDNRPVQLVRVDRGGTWTSSLPNIDTGVYTLRIDEIAQDGSVANSIDTPFQRTAPEVAAAARRDGIAAITVQPGYTLWAISQGYFGDGIRYVQIFEANRQTIRNPDLIYPGQVFTLPEVSE